VDRTTKEKREHRRAEALETNVRLEQSDCDHEGDSEDDDESDDEDDNEGAGHVGENRLAFVIEELDSPEPEAGLSVTRVRFRFPHGHGQQVRRFGVHATVGALYSFVRARILAAGEDYTFVLVTSFPRAVLRDPAVLFKPISVPCLHIY
jgi:hypothetical protein